MNVPLWDVLKQKCFRTICEVWGVERQSAAKVVINTFTNAEEIFALCRKIQSLDRMKDV